MYQNYTSHTLLSRCNSERRLHSVKMSIEDSLILAKYQPSIFSVWARYEYQLTSLEERLHIDKTVTLDIHVSAKYFGTLPKEQSSQLKGKGFSHIIVVPFERHAQNTTSCASQCSAIQSQFFLGLFYYTIRQCFIHKHSSMP